jgi:hypothetical protein
MNNNNFVSKTLKTFLTSLFVSVFIFGSLYFFLSDNSTTTTKSKDVKSASNSEKSKKLVVEEEKEEPTTKVEDFVARQNETERQVLGATTDKLIAQNIPGTNDFTNLFQNTAPTPVVTTPTVAITGTLPTNLATTTNSTVYATGVPQTGNESLYIILGIFSTIAGFLIINGKSIAMRSFEQI